MPIPRISASKLAGAASAALLMLFAAAFAALVFSRDASPAGQKTITLAGREIRVTIADTPEERAHGLSGRVRLSEDEGMLFVFPGDGKYAFWMKDMRFSIDILWIAADGEVVHIVERAAPETYPRTFVSEGLARYVLELPAGDAEVRNVRVGDIVRL